MWYVYVWCLHMNVPVSVHGGQCRAYGIFYHSLPYYLETGLTKLEVCSFVLVLLASELPSASQCWDYRHA